MGRIIVTGSAGFLGTAAVERLRTTGADVVGVDRVAGCDLAVAPLDEVVAGAEAVLHFAGQPGVRASWGPSFEAYCRDNVLGTQRLLDACVRARTRRVVVASSSSVYGATDGPVTEDAPTRPVSPYGVSKLAAEQLGSAYARSLGLSVVALRFFTVYGPGQRPDMLVHRVLDAIERDEPLRVFGDGTQVRDLTFVDDVLDAVLAAAGADLAPGTVLNVGGANPATVNEIIEVAAVATGRRVRVEHGPAAVGDVASTHACIARAETLLGWAPSTSLASGIAAQAAARLLPALDLTVPSGP